MSTEARPLPVYSVAIVAKGFVLQRNGATVLTPTGNAVIVPTAALAEALAAEWRAPTTQDLRAYKAHQKINAAMPLMQLAATALDIVPKERASIIDQLAAYTGSELLCHRADDIPALAERQQRLWQPVLDWCATHFGAALKIGSGIVPIAQSDSARQILRGAVAAYDDFRLTGLRQAVDISGSLILGLALAEKHLNAAQIFAASELEASFQTEKWGEDPAMASRRAAVLKDLELCQTWFGLLKA